jgi:DNA polymerase I-like protein with 3'-5' exonuclease and polymerase domains
MIVKPSTVDAYQLLHEGVVAFSEVERNGICIDTNYLNKAINETTQKIKDDTKKLYADEVFKQWKKQYGQNTNLDSTDQLGTVLFKVMGHKCPSLTKTGKPKTDIATLERLKVPFVKDYLALKKIKKAKSTYLMGIQRETVDGYLHPVFNLHLVSTYRGSSDSPNFQNMPIRNFEMGKLIRQCFIPRASNRCIVETDYSGIEVHGAAWYHKDPTMLNYIHDKTKDMHRDMAQQCYKLPAKEMIALSGDKDDAKRIKNIRFCGKNQFVFPEFYGDWWFSCAPCLWNMIDQMGLHTRDGRSLKKHLKLKGIRKLGVLDMEVRPAPGTFLHHIKEV